jgi:hypothetical protein
MNSGLTRHGFISTNVQAFTDLAVVVASRTAMMTTYPVVQPPKQNKKRSAFAARIPGPQCVFRVSDEDISKACACFTDVPGVAKTATVKKSTTMPTVTTTQQHRIAATTTTTNSDVTRMATVTLTACTQTAMTAPRMGTYLRYHAGANFIENDSNPGNPAPAKAPPAATTYPGVWDACFVLEVCANDAAADSYKSFQVYFDQINAVWMCRWYQERNTNESYFNWNNNSPLVYGFSLR